MEFSVLIPMYNAEKYISESLESVLAQDYQDYEIIIVDDGSTDNSPAIVDSYQKRYPNRIRAIHKQNSGVLLTRRRAIQEAKGEYIIWVDADDVVKSDLMRTMHEQIGQNHPDIIIYDYELIDSPQKIIYSLDLGRSQADVDKHMVCSRLVLGKNMNELWTKCIRRELIDIDEDYSCYRHVRMGDDAFCLLPIIDAAEKITYVNIPFYRYRTVESSITHTTGYKSYPSYRTLFERENEYLNKWHFSDQEQLEAKRKFSTKIIGFILQCIYSETDMEEYRRFVRQVTKDESKKPICLSDKKNIRNSKIRLCYGLWLKKRYLSLYYVGKALQLFSTVKNIFVNGD